jgi:hypothetical protein
MRTDNRLKSISLTKRPNGREMRFPKPMRLARPDAERLVESGRATFISKKKFREMVSEMPKPESPRKKARKKKVKKK